MLKKSIALDYNNPVKRHVILNINPSRLGKQMPCIINTPEDWFRIQQRDLIVIQYREPAKTTEDNSDENDHTKSAYIKAQLALNA